MKKTIAENNREMKKIRKTHVAKSFQENVSTCIKNDSTSTNENIDFTMQPFRTCRKLLLNLQVCKLNILRLIVKSLYKSLGFEHLRYVVTNAKCHYFSECFVVMLNQ